MLKDTWVDKKDGVDINSAEDINQVAHAVIDLENDGGSGVHIGSEAPEDGSDVWIDTDEQPEIGEPDWAANEGDAGHIKNRTHYVDAFGKVHKLDNKFINSEWMATKEESGGSVELEADFAFTSAYYFLDPHWFPEVGFEWDVYWNGVKYSPSFVTADGEAFLGNRRMVSEDYPDTGEPFLFTGYALSNQDPEIVAVKKNTSAQETVNVVITTRHYTEYNKLPKEYLPDDIGGSIDVTASVGQTIVVKEVDANGKPTKWEAVDMQERTHWSEEGLVQVLAVRTHQSTLNATYGAYGFYPAFNRYVESFPLSSVYSIVYDGIEYTNLATFETNGMRFFGNLYFLNTMFGTSFENTGEPFLLGGDSSGMLMITTDTEETTHTVEIYINGTYHHQLDMCYFPQIPVIDLTGYYSTTENNTQITISGGNYFTEVYEVMRKNEIVRIVFRNADNQIISGIGFVSRMSDFADLFVQIYGAYNKTLRIQAQYSTAFLFLA